MCRLQWITYFPLILKYYYLIQTSKQLRVLVEGVPHSAVYTVCLKRLDFMRNQMNALQRAPLFCSCKHNTGLQFFSPTLRKRNESRDCRKHLYLKTSCRLRGTTREGDILFPTLTGWFNVKSGLKTEMFSLWVTLFLHRQSDHQRKRKKE